MNTVAHYPHFCKSGIIILFLSSVYLFYSFFIHEPIHYLTAISLGYPASLVLSSVVPYVKLHNPENIPPLHYFLIALSPYLFGLLFMGLMRVSSLFFPNFKKFRSVVVFLLCTDITLNFVFMPVAYVLIGFNDFSNVLIRAQLLGVRTMITLAVAEVIIFAAAVLLFHWLAPSFLELFEREKINKATVRIS